MANLLYLVHRLPYPPNKGDKVRSYHLLKHLTASHTVYLGTFVDDPDDLRHLDTVRALCADMHAEPLDPPRAKLRSLSAMLTGEPLSLPYYRSAAMRDWVAAIRRRQAIDATVVFSSVMAEYATASDLPAALAGEWSEWWPAHGLWLPLGGQGPPPTAGLLLARETAWSASEMALLAEWTHAWWHALLALRRAQQRPWWQPWGRDTAGALDNRRAWWRRPFLFSALALAAASFVPVRLSVLAPGELVPVNPVIVRAPLDGVVDVFHVKPNQSVKKGEPLFGFDEALIQSRLEVANQALATASTEYRQTLQQALSDPRVRPQLATLTGRIQEKRSEVNYLREQLTRARVLAPKDGVALFDDPTEWIGRPVSVGERILRIAATGDVEVEAWLPLADAIALEPGAPVQLYLNARPLEPVSASLRYMAHEAAPRPDGTFAYRVRATLDAATEHRVGLKGTAKLQGETVPAAWWVMRRPVATLRSALGL